MRQYIYYPGFEVRDELWLKFALLYIEKIYPIIPYSGETYLSEAYRRLTDETDFIVPHRPTDVDGFRASEVAIESVEKAFRRRKSFRPFFNGDNYLEVWQNSESHTYRLFEEKFTYDFKLFCLENRIATECGEGLRLSEDLAHYYMTHLAVEIGKEKELPIITDYENCDRIKNYFMYGHSKELAAQRAAKYLISLSIPKHLSEISLSDIIAIRNDNDYMTLLRGFNRELSKYLESIGDGTVSYTGFSDYIAEKDRIAGFMLQRGWQLAAVAIGTWLVFDNPTVGQFLRQAIIGSGQLVTDYVIGIRPFKQSTNDARSASRFLTRLHNARLSGGA